MVRSPSRSQSRSSSRSRRDPPGLAARSIAADLLDNVLRRRRPLDDLLSGENAHPGLAALAERDRALVRRLVATVLRRYGTLQQLLGGYLKSGPPKDAPRVETALLLGAAQILLMDVPDHAAVDLSVRLVRADRRAMHFASLVNAVLRRVTREGRDTIARIDAAATDLPAWLLDRWRRHYGDDEARAIAASIAHEPALDLTIKNANEAPSWADRLGGRLLPTGTVRLAAHGPVTQLPGFEDGAWWVQDAAAALPARLLGDVRGQRIADLCAAPGGKTAQLASLGAEVVAVDRVEARLTRLRSNLERLDLKAETVTADVAEWTGGPFDAVLLDAPCSSTGTIRRHPDIPLIKSAADIASLAAYQARLLRHAAERVRPGGTLVYCTCSIEPEEGPDIVAEFLGTAPAWRRLPVTPAELAGHGELLNGDGDLRTLPYHLPDSDPRMAGLDGFYAARLVRRS